MAETRVDLQHLLEDLRDQYPFSIEEAIVTEVTANALDSGASIIDFRVDPKARTVTVVDNGKGMRPEDFEEYHNIASSTKTKGKGIGFAGVGVKLALLYQSYIRTETRRQDFHSASIWHLDDRYHAPWENEKPQGLVTTERGTAITITVDSANSTLLDVAWLTSVVQRHFQPLFDRGFDPIVRSLYLEGVHFLANGAVMQEETVDVPQQQRFFPIYLGRNPRRKGTPDGIGMLRKWTYDLQDDERGVAVSTYGKVVTRGWDWLDVPVKNRARIQGTIEAPGLAEILTTSKTDFMKYGASGQKYYRFRKAAQGAVTKVLRDFGELPDEHKETELVPEPLQQEIQAIMQQMLTSYPELSGFLERAGRGTPTTGLIPDEDGNLHSGMAEGADTLTGTRGGRGRGGGIDIAPGNLPGLRLDSNVDGEHQARQHEGKRRLPSIFVSYEDDPSRQDLGWLREGTLWINQAHPAYKRAAATGVLNYHIIVSAGWAFLAYIEPVKRPEFMNRFLVGWGGSR